MIRAVLPLVLSLGLAPLSTDEPAWTAPAEERQRVNPVASSKEARQRGRTLFLKHCSTCHGPQGRGDGPAAAFGLITPRNLSSSAVQQSLTDGEMFWKLSTGRRVGRDILMPPGEENIRSAEDRWKVVLFVRTLARVE